MFFWKNNDFFSSSVWGNAPKLQIAMVEFPNINLVISKQNKAPKIDLKNVKAVGWYCYSIPVFYINKLTSTIKYK